jgi:hypothetical protein
MFVLWLLPAVAPLGWLCLCLPGGCWSVVFAGLSLLLWLGCKVVGLLCRLCSKQLTNVLCVLLSLRRAEDVAQALIGSGGRGGIDCR